MRPLIALSLLAVATPAAAQTTQFELDNLRMQQLQLQQRSVAQTNELSTLDARLRTEQAVTEQQLARVPVRAPVPPYEVTLPSPQFDASKLPQISDAALAESNRRVQAAAANRR
jgi:hypothetical protein